MRHPWTKPQFSWVMITIVRASAQIINRYGDSGSPGEALVKGELGLILSHGAEWCIELRRYMV